MTPAKQADQDKKDLAKGAGVNFIGFIVRLGSRLPFMVLVLALYGNDLYARLIYITTVVEIAAAFSALGFKRSLFKFLHDEEYNSRHSTEEVIVSALTLAFVISLMVTALVILSAQGLAVIFNYPEMVAGLTALAPIIIVITLLDVLLAGTRATRKMRYEVISRSFVEPYMLLGAMLLFYFLGNGEMGLLQAYATALVAALLVALWGSIRIYSWENFRKARPRFKLMSDLAKFSGPTAFHDLALLIFMRMDIFTVKFFFSESTLGIYNIAQQITTTVEKIYQSFYPILAPVMAKNLVEGDYAVVEQRMIMVSRWILLIQCMIVVWSIFYAEGIISLIAHKDTDPGLIAMGGIVLFFLMVGETINGGFGTADLPIMYRKPLFNPVISVVMIFSYVATAFAFVQILDLGPEGVAMALCTTYLIMNLIRVALIRRLFGIKMLRLKLLRVIFASMGSAITFKVCLLYSPIDLMHGWGAALGVILLIIIYGLTQYAFGLTENDKSKLRAKLGRNKA